MLDARSLYHLKHRAHQRALAARSWHSLAPETPPHETPPTSAPAGEFPPSSGGGKFRFLSLLFARKSPPPSAANSSFTAEGEASPLRPARRGASLPRSASAGRISDVGSARPARSVRWNIDPDVDKTPSIVLPTWKRPKKVLVRESCV